MTKDILPNALRLAAAGCDDAKWIGEILLALCGRSDKGLDRGQKVVLAMCRAEIAERQEQRAAQAERKRRQRGRGQDARQGDLFDARKGTRK